jgi:Reverse transcriptase (RNA-dependent DNA polymerase).
MGPWAKTKKLYTSVVVTPAPIRIPTQQPLVPSFMLARQKLFTLPLQGSKLGPLLFILYINDLPEMLKYCKIPMFADDTLLYISGTNIAELSTRMNVELEGVNG